MVITALWLITAHVVVLAGRLLLAVDVDGQDGVAAAAVVVHVVSPYRPILETLLITICHQFLSTQYVYYHLEHGHKVVELPALDTKQVVHHESPGPLVPSDGQIGSLSTRIQ